MSLKLKLSPQQLLGLRTLDDPQVTDILWGGGAGGGKSWMICLWMLLSCRNYAGIRIGLGRKELTRLKQTTVLTLLREVHPILGVKPHEFNYNENKGLIEYKNSSQIQLLDLARQPSDPDFDTFGSLELTHLAVEEGAEITKKALDVLGSRKNRWLNKEYGLTGKTIISTNPTQNFIRQEFYEPYRKFGMGNMQKWEFGEVEVNGEMMPAYRAFIKSLVIDNPFISRNYIESLRKLPTPERRRLLEGNWDYEDKDSLLFTSLALDRSMISQPQPGKKYIGVDVADKGNDKTILSLEEGGVLVNVVHLKIDVAGEKAISEQTALEIIKFAQQNGVGAREIAVDTVGIGVGVRDFLRSKGWFVVEFIAGARPTAEGYRNLRSQAYWELSQDMQQGGAKMYSELEHLGSVRQELSAHEYEMESDRVVRVLSKDKVKETLGHSPDFSDSYVIAHWVAKGQLDPKYNSNRVSF